MILIKNKQRKISINIQQLEKYTQILLDALHYSDFDIAVIITTDKTIREYNKQYRTIDKATDILSFAYHTELKAGQRIKPETDDDKSLGDIIISAPYVAQDAQKLNIPFEERLKVLLVHGICHLLGYDHIQDADYKKMHAKEIKLLTLLQ